MKRILTFVFIAFQMSLFANGSVTCPRSIKLNLKEIQRLSQTNQSIGYRGMLRITMRITQITAGRCYFEGRNNKGEFFWGHLEESDGIYTASPLVLILKSDDKFIPVGVDKTNPLQTKESYVEILHKKTKKPIARSNYVHFN